MKKIILGLFAIVSMLGVTNVFADTIGGSFVSIPIHKDSSSTDDVTQDLSLKAGGLVDQTNGIYYAVGTIPSAWSGDTVGGIEIKDSSNCDDADVNVSCIQTTKPALFVLTGNDDGVVIAKIIQLTKNGVTAGTNWWGIHKNAEGDVFLIENIGSDIRFWTLVGTDLANPTLTDDSPVTIDANIDYYNGISLVNDYLFYHGGKEIASTSRDRTQTPRFVVISLNGTTPTLVYQWGEDKGNRGRLALKLSQDITSWSQLTPSMVQGVMYVQDSNDPTVPYSQYNAYKQGYTYAIKQDAQSDRGKWGFYIKGMFMKDNKLYAIAYFNHYGTPDFSKMTLNSDGTIGYTDLTSDVSDTSIDEVLGKYFIMQFDFSPVSQ